MSKMSQLHMELSEQATELGFESLDMALANGYDIDYQSRTLVNGQELAHKAWLEERDEVLEGLSEMCAGAVQGGYEQKILERAIEFIEKGEV